MKILDIISLCSGQPVTKENLKTGLLVQIISDKHNFWQGKSSKYIGKIGKISYISFGTKFEFTCVIVRVNEKEGIPAVNIEDIIMV